MQSSFAMDGWTDLGPVDYEVVSVTGVAPGISRVVIKVSAGLGQKFMRLKKPD